jgi:hypothetical protein
MVEVIAAALTPHRRVYSLHFFNDETCRAERNVFPGERAPATSSDAANGASVKTGGLLTSGETLGLK